MKNIVTQVKKQKQTTLIGSSLFLLLVGLPTALIADMTGQDAVKKIQIVRNAMTKSFIPKFQAAQKAFKNQEDLLNKINLTPISSTELTKQTEQDVKIGDLNQRLYQTNLFGAFIDQLMASDVILPKESDESFDSYVARFPAWRNYLERKLTQFTQETNELNKDIKKLQ